MSKKHQRFILGYLLIGLVVAMIRRQWGGGSVYPFLSSLTLRDTVLWPLSVVGMGSLYFETGSIAGGPVKGTVNMGPVVRVPTTVQSVGTAQSVGTIGA
jgi:hypothetical protein